MKLYICTKFHENMFNVISNGADTISILNITKGHNLVKTVGGVTVTSGPATYFRFSFRFFKKGSCQLLGKVCARSTG